MDKLTEDMNKQFEQDKEIYDSEIDLSLNIDYSDDDMIVIDSVRDIVDNSLVRVKMNGILVCFDGSAMVDINHKQVIIKKNQLVIFAPNTLFNNFLFSVDFKCKLILLTNRIIQHFLRPYLRVWNQVMYMNELKVRDLTEIDMAFVNKMCEMMSFCKQYTSNPYRTEIIKSTVLGGLLGLCGILSLEQKDKDTDFKPHGNEVFPRFLEMLQNCKVKHKPVSEYASKLCITPKYLTTLCKQNSGKTAMQWIEEYTLADIDYYIRSTNLSVKEISNLLGFPNTSFFGKYFKEHFGMSPKRFRNAQAQKKNEAE